MSALRLVPVLTGGGTRLPVHVGVLAALQELGASYQRLVGVSGGSIVAALHAAGWTPARMLELAHEINFARFRGHSLIELLMRGGLSSGSVFERWLDGVLEGRRFEDLELDLAVVATDVRASRPVIFERATTPTMKVARAVRFSMGIPLLFSFQAYEGALLVDGSILSEDALHREWTSDGTPVCVFRLRSEQSGRPLPMNGWFPLIGYTHMLIRTFMTTISREFVDAKHWPRTVVIDSGPLSPLEFRLDRAQKNDLYQRGYQTTRNILPVKFKFSPSSNAA
ncbi:MAG TPA: patatin-like phospholipase family protein [Steroidobacteraceae bacterium]